MDFKWIYVEVEVEKETTMTFWVLVHHGTAGVNFSFGYSEVIQSEEPPRSSMTLGVSGPYDTYEEAQEAYHHYQAHQDEVRSYLEGDVDDEYLDDEYLADVYFDDLNKLRAMSELSIECHGRIWTLTRYTHEDDAYVLQSRSTDNDEKISGIFFTAEECLVGLYHPERTIPKYRDSLVYSGKPLPSLCEWQIPL